MERIHCYWKVLHRLIRPYPFRVKRYDENGKLKEKVTYENNRPKGLAQFYYANGQLKKILKYYTEAAADSSSTTPLLKYQIVSFYDSLGVQLVKNGNGFAVEKSQAWVNNGKYVNGFKDGIWIGEGVNDIRSYRETYIKGELKSGVSGKEGKQYNYTKEEVMPEFSGGINLFYQFVGKTYKCSAAAIKNAVSGRIILSFVVEKHGTTTDLKVLKDLGLGTGAQAIKLMKKSPDWNPGSQHGIIPVRVQYTLPIELKLMD